MEKVLFIYYMSATVLLLVASLLVIYTPMDVENNWLYNIFYLITISVLSYYFYKLLNSKIKKNIIIVLFILNVLFFIFYNIVLMRFYHGFNEHVYGICFLSIVVYSFMYYDQLLRNVSELNILQQFDFWLVSSYLVYFLGCPVIALYYKTVPIPERGTVWTMQNVILFISSLIVLAGYLNIHSRRKLN